MASIHTLLKSGAAALTLLTAGAGAAEAQTYSNDRMMQADLNVARADYNARQATCNSRLYSGSRNDFSNAVARNAQARACRAEAQADYLDDVANIQSRNGHSNLSTLQQAFNVRIQAVRLSYDADIAQCNARFVRRLDRSDDLRGLARGGADAQRCQAQAERRLHSGQARVTQRYERAIARSGR